MSQEEQTIKLDQRDVLDAAMTAGHILLENGAEIFRVEETIDRICHHFGVQSENAFVLSNGIFLTSGDEHEKRFARVEHIPVRGAQLHRVAAVNQLSREIEDGTDPKCAGRFQKGTGADVRSWQRLFLSDVRRNVAGLCRSLCDRVSAVSVFALVKRQML